MLFKILQGDSSRISTSTTPLHPGWCYYTRDDKKFYIDSQNASGTTERACINPDSKAVDGTLSKTGWTNRRQTISVNGLKANQNGMIGISHNITVAQMEAAKNAEMYICDQKDGALTIECLGDVPQIDIPVVTVLL